MSYQTSKTYSDSAREKKEKPGFLCFYVQPNSASCNTEPYLQKTRVNATCTTRKATPELQAMPEHSCHCLCWSEARSSWASLYLLAKEVFWTDHCLARILLPPHPQINLHVSTCKASKKQNTTQKESHINTIKRACLKVKIFTLASLIIALYKLQCKFTLKTRFFCWSLFLLN